MSHKIDTEYILDKLRIHYKVNTITQLSNKIGVDSLLLRGWIKKNQEDKIINSLLLNDINICEIDGLKNLKDTYQNKEIPQEQNIYGVLLKLRNFYGVETNSKLSEKININLPLLSSWQKENRIDKLIEFLSSKDIDIYRINGLEELKYTSPKQEPETIVKDIIEEKAILPKRDIDTIISYIEKEFGFKNDDLIKKIRIGKGMLTRWKNNNHIDSLLDALESCGIDTAKIVAMFISLPIVSDWNDAKIKKLRKEALVISNMQEVLLVINTVKDHCNTKTDIELCEKIDVATSYLDRCKLEGYTNRLLLKMIDANIPLGEMEKIKNIVEKYEIREKDINKLIRKIQLQFSLKNNKNVCTFLEIENRILVSIKKKNKINKLMTYIGRLGIEAKDIDGAEAIILDYNKSIDVGLKAYTVDHADADRVFFRVKQSLSILTDYQLAGRIGVSHSTLYSWKRNGKIKKIIDFLSSKNIDIYKIKGLENFETLHPKEELILNEETCSSSSKKEKLDHMFRNREIDYTLPGGGLNCTLPDEGLDYILSNGELSYILLKVRQFFKVKNNFELGEKIDLGVRTLYRWKKENNIENFINYFAQKDINIYEMDGLEKFKEAYQKQ